MVKKEIEELRKEMKKKNIDAYLVTSEDYHGSEYVGAHFKCRAFLSGFTGSAGTLVVTENMAGLWTDGRYFLQAGQQLKDTGIKLFPMGEEGVPTVADFLAEQLNKGERLGFDGRTVNAAEAEKLEKNLKEKQIKLVWDADLTDEIWKHRPAMSAEPAFFLETRYAGVERKQKIQELKQHLKEKSADYLFMASLDDIAWTLNIRGNDVAYNPVVLSYLLIGQDESVFYTQESVLNQSMIQILSEENIKCQSYHMVYQDLQKVTSGKTVLIDKRRINYRLEQTMGQKAHLVDEISPVVLKKAVKNPIEAANEKEAHVKDGVAVCRFLYWLKHQVGKIPMTECSVAEKLEEFRSQGSNYKGQSFDPIAAYGAHGAIVHYSATRETDWKVTPGSFLLLDTGGQYLEGTTDITRTVALTPVTEEMKLHYTAVLRGNLNLAAAKFKKGCTGANFDYLARAPLWELGLDYNHGTGHGVGYYLNVHEAPNSFRYRIAPKAEDNPVFEPGMITSDEPGLYLEGKYGIRLENLVLCSEYKKTEMGDFLQFETLTMVPFDREAIDTGKMSEKEIDLLNQYHKKVYDTISPFLIGEEKEWLKAETAAL